MSGVGCVTATGEDIQTRRKASVCVPCWVTLCASSVPRVSAVTFESSVAPDVRFSLLSVGLLLKKGWSVSFGSEPGFLVLRFLGGDQIRTSSGFQNCFWFGLQHRQHTSSDRCYVRNQCACTILVFCLPPASSRWHPAPTPRKSGERPTRRRTTRVSGRGQSRGLETPGSRQQGRRRELRRVRGSKQQGQH